MALRCWWSTTSLLFREATIGLAVPEGGTWRALLNTDAACYGGSGFTNGGATADIGHRRMVSRFRLR